MNKKLKKFKIKNENKIKIEIFKWTFKCLNVFKIRKVYQECFMSTMDCFSKNYIILLKA